MEQHYVGILVNTPLYRSIPGGRTKHEKIHYYEEAAQALGLIPCYFRLQDIQGCSQVQAYVKDGSGYRKKKLPVPTVIHNRTIYQRKSILKKILQLEKSGKKVFNLWNRYGKLYIYDILMKDVSLRPHLPCTVRATKQSITDMMNMFDSLILKPNIGSIGRGILKLDRMANGWQMIYPKGKGGRKWGRLFFRKKLPALLIKTIRSRPYCVQQRLPLACYEGRPFDLRVSVQRDQSGDWQVTGIAGKVAAKQKFLTNVAQGGSVYPLKSLLHPFPHLNPNEVRIAVEQFSLKTARHLSQYIPNLADIGLDIGITEFGFPVFIECNNRDLRYSFAKANMFAEWKATYHNPIGYARFLLNLEGSQSQTGSYCLNT